jgi:phosphotransferase system HPr-like phosphotransfer protein
MTPTLGDPMTATPVRRTVAVANPMGLHMRANGKDLIELIMLVAMPGTELVVEADGDDATDAVARLAELLSDPGDGL